MSAFPTQGFGGAGGRASGSMVLCRLSGAPSEASASGVSSGSVPPAPALPTTATATSGLTASSTMGSQHALLPPNRSFALGGWHSNRDSIASSSGDSKYPCSPLRRCAPRPHHIRSRHSAPGWASAGCPCAQEQVPRAQAAASAGSCRARKTRSRTTMATMARSTGCTTPTPGARRKSPLLPARRGSGLRAPRLLRRSRSCARA
jgi:hypothetical protein